MKTNDNSCQLLVLQCMHTNETDPVTFSYLARLRFQLHSRISIHTVDASLHELGLQTAETPQAMHCLPISARTHTFTHTNTHIHKDQQPLPGAIRSEQKHTRAYVIIRMHTRTVEGSKHINTFDLFYLCARAAPLTGFPHWFSVSASLWSATIDAIAIASASGQYDYKRMLQSLARIGRSGLSALLHCTPNYAYKQSHVAHMSK